MRITCKLRSQCPLFARAANVRWFRSGTKYGKSLTITGNNEKSGCKNAGKIGEIPGKIVDKSEFITNQCGVVPVSGNSELLLSLCYFWGPFPCSAVPCCCFTNMTYPASSPSNFTSSSSCQFYWLTLMALMLIYSRTNLTQPNFSLFP